MRDHVKDVVAQIVGFLSAILLFLGTINVKFEWFTEASISAFGIVLSAGIFLCITLYTIYQNFYGLTAKGRAKKAVLKRNNLEK